MYKCIGERITTVVIVFLLNTCLVQAQQSTQDRVDKIQIAIVLDVSSSMNQLMTQAKGQIWIIANMLNKAEKNGKKPLIEFSLITVGNEEPSSSGFCQINNRFTPDLDSISETLFSIESHGSNEYYSYAINLVLDSLIWSKNKKDMKIIVVAGNENFGQQYNYPNKIEYQKICKEAKKQKILINTMYCSTAVDSIAVDWEKAAQITDGKFMILNIKDKLDSHETVWDKSILNYNKKLNSTYIPHGKNGAKCLERQKIQDENAISMGGAHMRARVLYKISSSYFNDGWDVLDAYAKDSTFFLR